MAENDNPNWDQLETDVLRKIRLLRVAWEHTAEATHPELHKAMKRDLYVPALTVLARFCACVEETEEPDGAGDSKLTSGKAPHILR